MSQLDVDEVVPRVVHLSSGHTVRRRGRCSQRAPERGESFPDNLFVTLPAFGRNLYLNLTRDNTFLSGDFLVEERRSDHTPKFSHLSTEHLCFYSGFVINHTDSVASISTCGGLVKAYLFIVLVEHCILPSCLPDTVVHLLNSSYKFK